MGAWIEILIGIGIAHEMKSHPTMGAWIEIINPTIQPQTELCRTPRWVRGLKSFLVSAIKGSKRSHPTMGAWIEIINSFSFSCYICVAPHDRCVD